MDKTYIDKPALVEIKSGKILVARSKKNPDTFYMPGGKHKPKDDGTMETDQECLVRENGEELNIKIKPKTIKFFGSFEAQAHGRSEGTIVRMNCYTAEYEGEPTADPQKSEIAEIAWLDYSGRDKVGLVAQYIFDDLKERGLLEGHIDGEEAFLEEARQRRPKESLEGINTNIDRR